MKYNRLLVLIVLAGCQPHYTSGKTQCSDKKECPSGFSCSDDGTNAIHYCMDNKDLSCPSNSAFYCSSSKTCWSQPGACSTVTSCGTAKNPGYVICATAGYVPDCNGTTCSPGPGVGTGGSRDAGVGTGGAFDAGGAGGLKTSPIMGTGGAGGTGGIKTAPIVGTDGGGGNKDAGADALVFGGAGGTLGKGGAGGGSGGSTTASLCSGVPAPCSGNTSSSGCLAETGCAWNTTSATCSGTPSSCTSYTSSTYCLVNGCSWSGTLICTTSTVTSLCTSAQGTTTCSNCIASSCCAPLTACVNDTNCSGNSTGPAWDAYLACAMNCCRSACSSTTTAAADNLIPGGESPGGWSAVTSLPKSLSAQR